MHIDLRSTTARRRAALALVAGPLVTFAGMAATPWESEDSAAAYLAALEASPTQGQIAAILLIFGYALMGLAIATVLLHASGAPAKLKVAAGVLGFCAATILPGMVSVDFYDIALTETLPLQQAAEVNEQAGSYGLQAIYTAPAILGYLLGPILAIFAAWKAGLVPVWAPVALLVAGLGSFAVFSGVVMIVATGVLVVVFAAVARNVLGDELQTTSASASLATPTVTR